MAFNNEFRFEIVKNIAVLSTEKSGWTKEINLVSFNDNPPKYDIRTWIKNIRRWAKASRFQKMK